MGPSYSCSYADIAVDESIDQKVMSDFNLYYKHIALWARFRDDIYCPWRGNVHELKEFDIWLNSLDPKLKFEMKFSREGVEFLDLFIYSANNCIETRIYSKPSDPHAYLLPSSYHPTHICENIPYSVMSRVRRCCSEETAYEQAVWKYSVFLHKRDYSDSRIEHAINKVNAIPRAEFLKVNEKESAKSRSYPLVMKFNAKLPNMNYIIKNNVDILKRTPETAELFPERSIFVSYRVEKSIRDLITHSGFKTPAVNQVQSGGKVAPGNSKAVSSSGCNKCGNCKLCNNFLEETNFIWSHHTKEKFNIKTDLTCTTGNVIYAIHDNICKFTYVGYTSDNMRLRWANHKRHMKQNRKTCELASHIIQHSNSCHELDRASVQTFDSDLKEQISITLIEQVAIPPQSNSKVTISMLEHREEHWQCMLKAKSIYGGLNKRNAKHNKTRGA